MVIREGAEGDQGADAEDDCPGPLAPRPAAHQLPARSARRSHQPDGDQPGDHEDLELRTDRRRDEGRDDGDDDGAA